MALGDSPKTERFLGFLVKFSKNHQNPLLLSTEASKLLHKMTHRAVTGLFAIHPNFMTGGLSKHKHPAQHLDLQGPTGTYRDLLQGPTGS